MFVRFAPCNFTDRPHYIVYCVTNEFLYEGVVLQAISRYSYVFLTRNPNPKLMTLFDDNNSKCTFFLIHSCLNSQWKSNTWSVPQYQTLSNGMQPEWYRNISSPKSESRLRTLASCSWHQSVPVGRPIPEWTALMGSSLHGNLLQSTPYWPPAIVYSNLRS